MFTDIHRELQQLAEAADVAQRAWGRMTDTEREHVLAILNDAERAETIAIGVEARRRLDLARELESAVRKMEERR